MKIRFIGTIKCVLVLYILTIVVLINRIYDKDIEEDGQSETRFMNSSRNGTRRKATEKLFCNTSVINQTETRNRKLPEVRASLQALLRYGPGENGTAVQLGGVNLSIPILLERDEKHRFNTFLSDMVSLQRTVPDLRPKLCKLKKYPDDLPAASIVIIYRDELASILLRTVYSVLQMSPPNLIKEIILVDDGSKDWDLRAAVGIHAAALEKVKVVRHETPRGLMMARQSGIMATTSDYFIVMDGHMEVCTGWLEPLIYRLVQEPRALLCSHVGAVQKDTFEFRVGSNNPEDMSFEHVFPFFDHMSLDQMFAPFSAEFRRQRKKSVEPIPYGTVQGMMMVMKKDFFLHIGGFDPGMSIWGSEQIEMSVKAWMCGGRVEMVPCSVVGHMYRVTPWGGANKTHDFHSINKARMIHVWMDPPYSDIINDLLSDKNFTEGDIDPRRSIRSRNKCKPYQYFIDTVKSFSEVYIPLNIRRKGRIYNRAKDRCLDMAKVDDRGYDLIQYHCHAMLAANQYFIQTDAGLIRSTQSNTLSVQDGTLNIVELPEARPQREYIWLYDGNKKLVHKLSGLCLTTGGNDKLTMRNCTSVLNRQQIWEWH